MSNAITIRHIKNGNFSDEDVKAITHVNLTAFKTHAFHVITTRNRPELWALPEVQGVILGGDFYLAERDGKVVGATGVFPPGTEFLNTEEHQAKVLGPFGAQIEPDLQEWFIGYFSPAYKEQSVRTFGPTGKLDNYHFQTVCVLPEYHGQGIARKLIEHVRDIAHPQGVAISLEANTAQNVAIYQKVGLKLIGDTVFRGPEPLNEDLYFNFMEWKP